MREVPRSNPCTTRHPPVSLICSGFPGRLRTLERRNSVLEHFLNLCEGPLTLVGFAGPPANMLCCRIDGGERVWRHGLPQALPRRRNRRLAEAVSPGEEPSFQDPLSLSAVLSSLRQPKHAVRVRAGQCSVPVLRGGERQKA